ncbi:ABC transporter substrate-binding protein [Paenibacillus xylaniclasticus]|uniref:ABC transporter substrate-binding protein n=1 Tax=Paenibacillus xylaniclasticus TaxID=588083 RepID=UPI000FD8C778|nr:MULTISPECIES: extracellular solute-binding protein [Paenibacillus]GFN29922.1 hypothetical protein PCURB6_01820 [Paenibacillus curdlanolyticus]
MRSELEQQPYWERQLVEQPLRSGGFTSEIERKVRERIRMDQRNGKPRGWFRTVAALTAFVVLLGGGWLFRDDLGSMLKQPDKNNGVPAALRNDSLADLDVTLKVMISQYDNFTTMQEARPFLLHHPSVSIETALMQDNDKLLEWVDKEQPDILRLSLNQYYTLAQQGKLLPLDVLIKKDGVDVDAMYQPIIELLRQYGGGQLHGLTAEFQTRAVFVNKELFQQYGIPLPRDGMTWDELLETAARFQGTGTAGLLANPWSGSSLYSLVEYIRISSGLQTDTQRGEQITVDTPAWIDLWNKVAAGYREGWIYRSPEQSDSAALSFTPSDAFLKGDAAMIIAGPYYMQQINQVWKGDKQQQWMTVTVPGNQIWDTYLGEIYAVSSTASNEKAAWEFVKFMTGREFAKRLIGMGMTDTPVRESDVPEDMKEQTAAFYRNDLELPGDLSLVTEAVEQTNDTLASEAIELSAPLFKAVVDNELTAEQALAQLKEALSQAAAVPKEDRTQ